jgi:hypothetical protein
VQKFLSLMLLAVALTGGARSSAMPLAQDTIQITSAAALACGGEGAQKVAFQRAAVETIRRGYDRFVILGADAQSDRHVLGYTPTYGRTTGSATSTLYGRTATTYGSSNTTITGGQPITAGRTKRG